MMQFLRFLGFLGFFIFLHNAWIPFCHAQSLSDLTIITFKSGRISSLVGTEIDKIRVAAYRDGKFNSVPFQIDKANPNGDYLFPGDKGYDRAVLSKQDEFVLQGDDFGNGFSGKMPFRQEKVIELAVTKNDVRGYVYIGLFDIDMSSKDYIRYDPETHGVSSDRYTVNCHPDNPSFFSDIIMGGVDHLDRVKLRANASMFFGKLKIQRTEEDIIGTRVEVVDGPVRVLQRVSYKVRIIGGVHSPTVSRVTKNYKAAYHIPNKLKVPFDLDVVFSELDSLAGFDFSPEISGAKIYCTTCGRGFTVNGKMDEGEFSDIGSGSRTGALCSKYGVLAVSVQTSKEVEGLPIKPGGVYRDEQNTQHPPEDISGMFGFLGYEMGDLERMPKGEYNFAMAMLFPDRCPKNEGLEKVADDYWGKYEMKFRVVK